MSTEEITRMRPAARRERQAAQVLPQFQSLLGQVLNAAGQDEVITIGVTSVRPGAGVSTVAANLAACAAGSVFGKVLLVDANTSRSSLRRTFSLDRGPGLAELLLGSASLEECIQQVAVDNLFVMGIGNVRRSNAPVIAPRDFKRFLDLASQQCRFIVLDLPAAAGASSCFSLVQELSGIVLVISADKDRSPRVRRCAKQLRDAGGHVIGAVLNKQHERLPEWLDESLA